MVSSFHTFFVYLLCLVFTTVCPVLATDHSPSHNLTTTIGEKKAKDIGRKIHCTSQIKPKGKEISLASFICESSGLSSSGQISQCLFIQREMKFYRTICVCVHVDVQFVLTATSVPWWWAVCINLFLRKQNHGSTWHQIRVSGRKKEK